MSFLRLIKLEWRKTIRSVAAGRKLISSIVMGIIGAIILLNILVLGFGLKAIIVAINGEQHIVEFLNVMLIFFFLAEMMYRFFLQKVSVIDLEHYLHLPVGRPKIIHFLLFRSFISPFNLVAIFLFSPICFQYMVPHYGAGPALCWLSSVILVSWTVHWIMVWFQQKFGDGLVGILTIFAIFMAGAGSVWYGWFNIGRWVEPFFTAAFQSPLPLLICVGLFIASYVVTFQFYRHHAYLEELDSRDQTQVVGDRLSLFGRFGLPGAIADLEMKLVLRHKRSRMALILSALFLGYGLIFYNDESFGFNEGVPAFAIFIGIFITGIFIMQYGQLFLSWNSSHFDFFLDRRHGIRALIKGKYLLFFGVSLAAYILSIPYVYFGWPILLVHTATFLFNIGINLHIIIYLALWKPKPMDLSKRGMFNYEGIGAAQFLMGIPMMGLPYLVYLPFAWWLNPMVGLLALSFFGLVGLIFYRQCMDIQVNRILKNRYAISSSFRQEL